LRKNSKVQSQVWKSFSSQQCHKFADLMRPYNVADRVTRLFYEKIAQIVAKTKLCIIELSTSSVNKLAQKVGPLIKFSQKLPK
jgi:hypothetical protein